MLKESVTVEQDPENLMSVRITGDRGLRKEIVLHLNGDQQSDEERYSDAAIVVEAINQYIHWRDFSVVADGKGGNP
jgi:hypothetical protein